MARPFTDSFLRLLQTKTGTEPVWIVALRLGLGIYYFSSKKMTKFNALPSVISITSIVNEMRADSEGTCGSTNVTISDFDGTIKGFHDNHQFEKSLAQVYMTYDDASEPGFCVLNGFIGGGVEWSEGDRTLTFSIEAMIEDVEAGFSAIDEFPDLCPEAKDVAWPMIFGSPSHVPALRVRKQAEGRLIMPIRLDSNFYKYVDDPSDPVYRIKEMDTECHVVTYQSADKIRDQIFIENGSTFPQNKPVEIVIDKVCFKGSFSGETFTVTEANTPYYVDIDVGPPLTSQLPQARLDLMLKHKITLKDFKGNLTGMHIYFQPPKRPVGSPVKNRVIYNFVEKQERDQAYLRYNLFDFDLTMQDKPLVEKKMTDGWIDRAYYILPNGIDSAYASTHEVLFQIEKYNISTWHMDPVTGVVTAKLNLDRFVLSGLMNDLINDVNKVMWHRPAGTVVRLKGEDPEIYIASCVHLTEVTSVVGKKSVVMPEGNTVKIFEAIPSDYYTIQLKSNYKLGQLPGIKSNLIAGSGRPEEDGTDYATAILFDEPLKDRMGEGWDDQIFITGKSSVGPKVTDIIKYLLKTYMPKKIQIGQMDDTDEDAHFAILEKKNVLQLCREIAWQARCALRLDGPKADLLFLDTEISPTITIDQDMVKAGTVKIGCTSINSIVTKLICRWRPDYRHLPMPNPETTNKIDLARIVGQLVKDVDRKENFLVHRQNVDRYGERVETKDVYIYNIERPVKKCADYWGNIYANAWRTVELELFLLGIFLQSFDTATLDISGFELGGYTNIRGLLTHSSVQPGEKTVGIKFRLKVVSGG